ncbi:MAG: 6-bladed beta-propeller [Gemmatimonadota bacterium]
MHIRTCVAAIALIAPMTLVAQQKVQLPARDKILSEKPAVVYSIGKEDGADWEMLSGVRWVAFDARDNLYVLDGNNYRVLVFDATGKYVRTISRPGQGPGELMAPTGMTVMTDGTIVVSDGSRRAYSLFNSDGSFARNALYGEGEGVGGRLEGLHMHPRGGVVTQIFPLRKRGSGSPGAPTGERKVPLRWINFSATGGSTLTLYEFTEPSIMPKVESAGRGISVTTLPANWTPPSTFGVLPNGGVVVSDEAHYSVKVVSPAGIVERILERPIAPRRGTQKDKETFLKREAESISQTARLSSRTGPSGGSTGANAPSLARLEEMLRSAAWLDVIPVLRRVRSDPQGRIWVARTPDDFGLYGPVDIIRADGAYIGTINNAMLPAAVSRTGRAAFIERDELGVEHVTVKRLPATWQ